MKILFSVIVALTLVGCGQTELNLRDSTLDQGQEATKSVGLGKVCNLITEDKIHCKMGLECKTNTEDPSLGGICVEEILNDIECPPDQNPVCGLRGNNKNGYLNGCEAERHGAIVLYKGFCKVNQKVVGNCNARVNTLGNCATVFEGFELDPDSGACRAVKVAGCVAEIPFETLEDCQEVCR